MGIRVEEVKNISILAIAKVITNAIASKNAPILYPVIYLVLHSGHWSTISTPSTHRKGMLTLLPHFVHLIFLLFICPKVC